MCDLCHGYSAVVLLSSDGTDVALGNGGVERRQCGIRSCVSHESSGGHNGSSHMLSEKDWRRRGWN